MTYELRQSEGSVVLVLNGECTIEHVAALKDVLQEAIRSGDLIEVNLDGVKGVDISLFQLLCAAHRRTLELDKRMAIDPPLPEAVQETARAAGYFRKVGCHKDPAKDCLWQGGYPE